MENNNNNSQFSEEVIINPEENTAVDSIDPVADENKPTDESDGTFEEFVYFEADNDVNTEGDDIESTAAIAEDGTVVVESTEVDETEESIKIDFQPMNFVNNLGYMGKGMLGIFVVIGIIIASVYALAKIGNKSNKQ